MPYVHMLQTATWPFAFPTSFQVGMTRTNVGTKVRIDNDASFLPRQSASLLGCNIEHSYCEGLVLSIIVGEEIGI